MSPPSVAVARAVADLRAQISAWRRQAKSVALVPTMGALHAGHVSLIKLALAKAERVVVSIFVNPRQFNAAHDLARYPRQEAQDIATVGAAGGHLVFAPREAEMYPPDFATTVDVAGLSEALCGAARPGHFKGVATVVAKLLLQTLPDIAVFGEKDYQQLFIIRRLVRDLDIPVAILSGPLVRDADGLALSSRNQNLRPHERQIARALPAALGEAVAALQAGDEVAAVLAAGRQRLLDAGFASVDYFDLRDARTLAPLAILDRPGRVLAAGHVGEVRLIDNMAVAAVKA
ncbi:MAG: pantoate--beta-alanine ligase [Pseudomonadota bacterium]